MRNKTNAYIVAIVVSIFTLLVANLIIGVLNYNRSITTLELEDAIHSVMFLE